MDLFTGLSSANASEKSSGKKTVFLTNASKFEMDILGEGHYQVNLKTICGSDSLEGVNQFETAWLILEDKNPQHKNAVRVEIRGKHVGYLTFEAATAYRRLLKTRGPPKAQGQCEAIIKGGWKSAGDRKGFYKVMLDLPTLP